MNTQQEYPECPDNSSLSWQEPAVIQLCYESEVSGSCSPSGTGEGGMCTGGTGPGMGCFGGDGVG